ncbi:MAG: sigma-70 family RNA polymerase sigma factor [Patescibacteria group bacterium]|jgi:RNA polymerase sigma factor (sigma-70 family)
MTDHQGSPISESLSKLLRHSMLDREEELRLIGRSQQGDRQALDSLVRHNLKFVMSIAKRYAGRGVELEDLFSEGAIGLQIAIKKFDVTSGNRLSTYAIWWIRQLIARYLDDHCRTIRVPIRVQKNLRDEESAEENDNRLTKAGLDNFSPVSLDQELSSGDDSNQNGCTLADTCADECKTASPETAVARAEVSDIITEAISQLTPREQYVIVKRFREELTLRNIAGTHTLSRERIRQIEAKALGKLRRLLQNKDIF